MLGHVIKRLIWAAYRMSTFRLCKGAHITRYYMYEYLTKYSEHRSESLKVLSISHSEKLAIILGFADNQIIDASYPDIDVLRLPFKNGEFDAVVSDQILEHVEGNPQQAIDETFRVLKDSGIALHTSCFIHPIHGYPSDFWRFTPEALKLLVGKHGDVIDVGSWGNPYVWLYVALGYLYVPIPHAKWHPANWLATKNHNSWPIVTWVLVKKRKMLIDIQ